ncbi:26S proteasome non-ATPase regulatory subunit 10-like isoform X2 [Branchiostoma lanceolatum]|uniref:26S proteasome non-ATPase regulatory subunit 10-like isoform X2 n=1 Tax=Branchiostoma lanceolatum TaxID=7740 RepID=UPI003451DC05
MAEMANELLQNATQKGSLEGVKAALRAGADIDLPSGYPPGTALFWACYDGHVDIVRLLLRKGASVVKRSVNAFSPLHAAAGKGRTELVELLVNHGATVDIRDGFHHTPLMAACSFNHVDTVRRLIELGARPDSIDKAQRSGIAVAVDGCEESLKLIQEAMKTKLLRCCNPKCGKPGYRKTLKLCAQCKMTRYCSRDCQKQHWSVGHKKCCGQDAYSDEGPDPYRQFDQFVAEYEQQI